MLGNPIGLLTLFRAVLGYSIFCTLLQLRVFFSAITAQFRVILALQQDQLLPVEFLTVVSSCLLRRSGFAIAGVRIAFRLSSGGISIAFRLSSGNTGRVCLLTSLLYTSGRHGFCQTIDWTGTTRNVQFLKVGRQIFSVLCAYIIVSWLCEPKWRPRPQPPFSRTKSPQANPGEGRPSSSTSSPLHVTK